MGNEPTKKNIVQDIMPQKRSIRNVEVPSRSERKVKNDIVSENVPPKKENIFEKKVQIKKIIKEEEEQEIPRKETPRNSFSYDYNYPEPKKNSKKVLYFSLAILLLASLFGISALFKSAKITVVPRNEMHTLTPKDVISAKKDDPSVSLSFQVVTISKDLEKTVTSDKEENVSKKATGSIVIYNNTAQAQKLVATTRFETSEGLIYRLVNPATVPAQKVSGGKTVPGSVEVVVEANEPGEKYNIGLVDFTIPGFKGTPKYTQIYARSKTKMSGGFVGLQKVVSDEVVKATDAELQNKLKEALLSDIALQIPDNFVLYKETLVYDFSPINGPVSKNDSVVLQKRATAKAIIFDKGSLSRVVVAKILPEFKDDIIKISNLDKLSFSLKDGQSADYLSSSNIDFTLSGDAQFVWVFDENKLKSDLLGLNKKQGRVLLGTYKSISEAWIETSPFWNQNIPNDPNKVKLLNNLAK